MEENRFFNSGAGAIGYPQAKKVNLNLSFILYTKLNSRWIADFSVKWENKTFKMIVREKLQNLRLGKEFIYLIPKT